MTRAVNRRSHNQPSREAGWLPVCQCARCRPVQPGVLAARRLSLFRDLSDLFDLLQSQSTPGAGSTDEVRADRASTR